MRLSNLITQEHGFIAVGIILVLCIIAELLLWKKERDAECVTSEVKE